MAISPREASQAGIIVDALKKEVMEKGARRTLLTKKVNLEKKQIKAILLQIGREVKIDGGVYSVVTGDLGYDVHTLHLKRIHAPK
jgi:predicted transcriptional regulator